MYVCPLCKTELNDNRCTGCSYVPRNVENVPVFFTDSTISKQYEKIGDIYDSIYDKREDVWKDCAGRGAQFNKYVANLVARYNPVRYMDLGCGQGYLLTEVSAKEKYGIDISHKALISIRNKTHAILCRGIAEELPYPDRYFDVISSIGVMTHLINDLAGIKEIHRVLRENGRYVAGIYVPPSRAESIKAKLMEFTHPHFRPFAFMHWVSGKLSRMMHIKSDGQKEDSTQQPVRRYYTPANLEKLFSTSGFAIEERITKMNTPQAPLPGAHFRLYILRRTST